MKTTAIFAVLEVDEERRKRRNLFPVIYSEKDVCVLAN